MTKMTYVNAIDNALAGIVDEETKERLEALKASLIKRNTSKSSTPTKRQRENEDVKARIADVLTSEGQTATAIAEKLGGAKSGITCQRVTALLKQMGVTKEVIKGKSLYFVA